VVKTREGNTHRIARGLLSATINVYGIDVRVAVTHLDHMQSTERCIQMGHVLETLGDDGQCLVLGDLNALNRGDYSSAEWELHEQYNDSNGWGAPIDEAAQDGVLSLLHESRFVDVHAAVERTSTGWQSPPWSAHCRDTERPPYRIDYAWSRAPSTMSGRRLVPLSASVATNCGAASDHQPVIFDLEAIAFDGGE